MINTIFIITFLTYKITNPIKNCIIYSIIVTYELHNFEDLIPS